MPIEDNTKEFYSIVDTSFTMMEQAVFSRFADTEMSKLARVQYIDVEDDTDPRD
jgi:hypothetical protein